MHRPDMEVEAVICHGVGLYIYVADEDISIGSEWVVECVVRTLSYVAERLASQGKQIPEHLHLQSDNTVAQGKNQHIMKLLISMVSQTLFRTCSLGFLSVGHTHEDVGYAHYC